MTVIAARKYKDRIEIASDSQTSYGFYNKNINPQENIKDKTKISKINNIVFGSSGHTEYAMRFKTFCAINNPKGSSISDIEDFFMLFHDYSKNKNSNYKAENSFIFIFGEKIFCVEGYFVFEVGEYCAIGSGMFYANTAMFLGKDVKEAVDVAKHFAGGVGGETEFIKINLSSKVKK